MSKEQIRNIIQSHQEREIVKTAPDMVVYIENLPYVLNPWIEGEGGSPLMFNVNDFVTAISVTAGVEHMVPTCSINLSVPNHLRHTIQAPGGNSVFNTMDEIQVYCKGYYFSKEGNSIYYRVFHGIITSIGITDNPSTTDVTFSCDGVLKLLELMLWAQNPATGNIGGMASTALMDVLGNENPYAQLATMFLYSTICSKTLGATLAMTSVNQADPKSQLYFDALAGHYIVKWQKKLDKISKMVRLFGVGKATINPDTLKMLTDSKETADPQRSANIVTSKKTEEDQQLDIFHDEINAYNPSMGVGRIEMLNSNVTNRLEKLRTLAEYIQYEMFQDLNGDIIIKPPLYNLDVLKLDNTRKGLVVETNPFVIYPTEVESEHRQEDQAQIRATRTSVQGSWSPGIHYAEGQNLLTTATYCDVHLTAKFGVRERGVKQAGFLPNDSRALFAMAVGELTRANRGYRSYTCTIPIRPELRLGYPVYIAHHDMYAYPRTVTINYALGGTAHMVLNCDTVRRRPMIRTKVEIQDPNTKEKVKTTVYKSVPNLVYKWTDAPTSAPATTPDTSGDGDVTGDFVTPPSKDLSVQQKKYRAWRAYKLGNLFEVAADTPTKSWRIANGDTGAFNPKSPHASLQLTKSKTGLLANTNYQQLIRTIQPYTDEKGYELIGPFPWGRWVTLEEAITKFAESNYLSSGPTDGVITRITDSGSAFVFAGIGTPQGLTVENVNALASVANDISSPYVNSFELTYDAPEVQNKTPENPDADKAASPAQQAAEEKEQSFLDKVDTMLDEFHKFANPKTSGSTRFRYRGRLGKLLNDTGFHPLEATLGNSDLANNWADATTNWANNLGADKVS
jgi:hypothetical protein